ncbi:Response regulator receiver domain-containing protein [Flavobacterium swingsii]|uniref:Response regulator receiver domain-containing protein n=1 Tax=Flavobacterium swingsii TaxID=498292 RepID=A0A1I0WW23_9FLAO|nr:response regulator [Flavobacterium swingsii]SFA92925.1 Response regulator receiver domain-containing protein [Flavobacterium swingsii]
MKIDNKIKLFLVDDDAVFLKSLEIQFLDHADFEIETFATGELCLANLSKKPDVVILDFHLDGIEKTAINGLQTLDEIKKFDAEIPVIMLSSQDKIEVAVQCIHHDAFDYVVKSETAFFRLQKIISSIFKLKQIKKELNWYMDRM